MCSLSVQHKKNNVYNNSLRHFSCIFCVHWNSKTVRYHCHLLLWISEVKGRRALHRRSSVPKGRGGAPQTVQSTDHSGPGWDNIQTVWYVWISWYNYDHDSYKSWHKYYQKQMLVFTISAFCLCFVLRYFCQRPGSVCQVSLRFVTLFLTVSTLIKTSQI